MAITNNSILRLTQFSRLSKWSAYDAVFEKVRGRFPLVPLSTILKRVKEPINIQDDLLYKRITVRLYGQGVLQRDEVLGKEIGTKRQFVAHAGQLIISRIDARNGAFGIVPEELEGAIVTNDFWLFQVQNALPEYLMLVLSSDLFQQYWQTQSSGTTNRQRVDEESLLSSMVSLPNQFVQKELTNHYKKAIIKASSLETETACRKKSVYSLWDRLLGIEEKREKPQKVFTTMRYSALIDWTPNPNGVALSSSFFPTVSVKHLCSVNSGGTPSRMNKAYYSGNIPWVKTTEVRDNEIYDTEEKITEEAIENSSARIYPPGCVIVAMYGQTRGQTAKLMISAATNQACAVLHSIDGNKVLTDYLWLYMQGQYHRIRKLAVGSAQPNLNAQMIKDYPVVLPPIFSSYPGEISQELIISKIKAELQTIESKNKEIASLRQQAKREFEEAVFGEA